MKHIKTQEERNALKTFLDSEDSQQPLRDIRSESNSNEKGRKYKRLAKKFLYADGTGKNVTEEDNYTKFFAGVPKTTAVSKVVDSIRRHINRPIKQAVKSMNPSGKLIPLDEFPLHTTTRLSFDEKTIKRFLAANLENRSLYEPELKKYVWDMENDKFAAGAIPICVCPDKDNTGLILADGQTRLMAMQITKRFDYVIEVRSITREERKFINGGRSNSFRDREKMGDAPTNTATSEHIVHSYIRIVLDKIKGKDFISDARTKGVYDELEDIIYKMKPLRKFGFGMKRKVPHGVFVALLEIYVKDPKKEPKILSFLDSLCRPNMADPKAPDKLSSALTEFLEKKVRGGHNRTNLAYEATQPAFRSYDKGWNGSKAEYCRILGLKAEVDDSDEDKDQDQD